LSSSITFGLLSYRKVDLVLRHVRDVMPPGSVAPNLRIQLRGFKNIFSSISKTEILEFHDKDGNVILRPLTYIKDPLEFKACISSMRSTDLNTVTTKYGLDNGQV
jgi:hypothetical protein